MTSNVNFNTYTPLHLNNKEQKISNVEKTNIKDNNTNKTQTDTVEIQGKSKKTISTGGKIEIAIGGGIIAGITALCLLKNKKATPKNFQEITQKFNQIYQRDFSKQEISSMINQYKEIFKLDNVDEFSNQLFKQIKKDAGLGDKDIKFFVNKCEPGTASTGGFWANAAQIMMDVECTNNKISNENKKSLFETLVHEFSHVHQHEQAYNADAERYLQCITGDTGVDAIISQYKEILALQNKDLIESMGGEDFLREIIEKLTNRDPETVALFQMPQEDTEYLANIKNLFGEPRHYDKNSEEYKKGIQYLENWENYIIPSKETMNKYREQLVEAEAYNMQDIATQITKLIGL